VPYEELLNSVKLSGPSFALVIVPSAAIVAQFAKFAPQAVLTAAASVWSRTSAKPTPTLPRFTPVFAKTSARPLSTEISSVPLEL
jgi:hypothetical protein